MAGRILIVEDDRRHVRRCSPSISSARGFEVTARDLARGGAGHAGPTTTSTRWSPTSRCRRLSGIAAVRAHRRQPPGHARHRHHRVRQHGHRRRRDPRRRLRLLAQAVRARRPAGAARSSAPLRHRSMQRELAAASRRGRRRALDSASSLGESPAMRQLFDLIDRVADSDASVLDHRRERHRQGAGGARAARAQRARERAVRRHQLRRGARAAARERAVRPRRGRVHRRAPGRAGVCSSRPTAAPCSSTRSATCRSACRPSCCARCRSARCGPWAATRDRRSTCASSPRPTATSKTRSQTARSARTCSSAQRHPASRVPPLRARGNDVLLLAQHFLSRFAAARRQADHRHREPRRPSGCWATAGPATCASCKTASSAPWRWRACEQIVVDDLPEQDPRLPGPPRHPRQ